MNSQTKLVAITQSGLGLWAGESKELRLFGKIKLYSDGYRAMSRNWKENHAHLKFESVLRSYKGLNNSDRSYINSYIRIHYE